MNVRVLHKENNETQEKILKPNESHKFETLTIKEGKN